MGLFDIFKRPPATQITYQPGGSANGVKLIYDSATGKFRYNGKFGLSLQFNEADIREVEIKNISRTHAVVLVQGEKECLATLDVLRILVCENAKLWIDSRGKYAYDYDSQLKGVWLNLSNLNENGTFGSPAQDALPNPHPSFQQGAQGKVAVPVEPENTPLKNDSFDGKEKNSVLDTLDAIKKLKELYDLGAITEEEFTIKKEELLKKV